MIHFLMASGKNLCPKRSEKYSEVKDQHAILHPSHKFHAFQLNCYKKKKKTKQLFSFKQMSKPNPIKT